MVTMGGGTWVDKEADSFPKLDLISVVNGERKSCFIPLYKYHQFTAQFNLKDIFFQREKVTVCCEDGKEPFSFV